MLLIKTQVHSWATGSGFVVLVNLNRQFSLLFLGMAMYDNIYES